MSNKNSGGGAVLILFWVALSAAGGACLISHRAALGGQASLVHAAWISIAFAFAFAAIGSVLYVQGARRFVRREAESARMLSTLMDNLRGMVYRCRNDADWTMEFVSEGCAEFTGYRPEDFVKNKTVSYNDVIHPDDRDRVRDEVEHALSQRGQFEIEYRIISRDGETRWVWERGCGIFDAEGGLTSLEGFITDVTLRRQVERALKERTAFLETLMDVAPSAIYFKDVSGRYRACNKTFCVWVGYPHEQIIGRTARDLYLPSLADHYMRKDQELLDRPGTQLYEYVLGNADGEERQVLFQKATLMGPGGQVLGLVGIATDISERKKAERAMRESEERFRTLFEHAPFGACVLDLEGRVLLGNRALHQIFGVSHTQMHGRHFREFSDPDEAARSATRFREVARGERETYFIEKRYRHSDGRQIWASAAVALLRDNRGEPYRILAMIEDITDRKRVAAELTRHRDRLEELVVERTRELESAQNQLLRRERLVTLGQLTATVSHELRNPLGTIRTSLFALRERLPNLSEEFDRILDRVDRNVGRCDSIIDELLDYARVREIRLRAVRLDHWLSDVLRDVPIPDGVRVVESYEWKGELNVDPDRFRRCIINILQNAYQSMSGPPPRAGVVTLTTRRTGERYEVRVRDQGCGIAPGDIEKAFEPLHSSKTYGVGLGLPTVRQIMAQHGGGVEVEQTSPRGTTMLLWLPRDASDMAPGARATTADTDARQDERAGP